MSTDTPAARAARSIAARRLGAIVEPWEIVQCVDDAPVVEVQVELAALAAAVRDLPARDARIRAETLRWAAENVRNTVSFPWANGDPGDWQGAIARHLDQLAADFERSEPGKGFHSSPQPPAIPAEGSVHPQPATGAPASPWDEPVDLSRYDFGAYDPPMSDQTPIPTEALEAAHAAAVANWHVMATSGHRQAIEAAIRAAAPILLAAGRTAAADEAEERASATVIATRQMFNDANARLRSLLLAALGIEDDGRTALVEYVHRLIADRENAYARGRTAAADAIEEHAESIGWYESSGTWAEAIEIARGADHGHS